mmetsp:Transcript_13926/g.18584  ORF Transcript_13926/g.18584 Transcript_13926/m.18584 type:complete len:163 (+) Transcript_13926:158-646(+)
MKIYNILLVLLVRPPLVTGFLWYHTKESEFYRNSAVTKNSPRFDPHRPLKGSIVPAIINALAGNGQNCEEAVADIVRQIDKEKLNVLLENAVLATPWIVKYKEEGRFGLPLDSSDPLIKLQRAECILAIFLLQYNHDTSLRASDFIEPDRLEVLSTIVTHDS